MKDPTNPPSGYNVYTGKSYISPQLADELLGTNMVTTESYITQKGNTKTTKKKIGKMLQEDVQLLRKMKNLFQLRGTMHNHDSQYLSFIRVTEIPSLHIQTNLP